VRGIEPPCAAWEAAVLPLNYTREEIFDFRFSIADCNRNKSSSARISFTPNGCNVRCPQRICRDREVSVRWGPATAGKLWTLQHENPDASRNYCQEITSSELVKLVLVPAVPSARSLPRDHEITPCGSGLGPAPLSFPYGLAVMLLV
jgi:hypothetical protein